MLLLSVVLRSSDVHHCIMERLWGAVCLFVLFAASVAAQDTNHQQQSCSVKVGAPVKTTSGMKSSYASQSASGLMATDNTPLGTVIGHNAPNATTVSEYIGIPFAHPPLGDLRFAPPVAYKSNRNITAARFVCVLFRCGITQCRKSNTISRATTVPLSTPALSLPSFPQLCATSSVTKV